MGGNGSLVKLPAIQVPFYEFVSVYNLKTNPEVQKQSVLLQQLMSVAYFPQKRITDYQLTDLLMRKDKNTILRMVYSVNGGAQKTYEIDVGAAFNPTEA